MHEPARLWVAQWATEEKVTVYEVGSREQQGSIRALFPRAYWLGVDLVQGPGVDLVRDATTWVPPGRHWDLAICTEVFEHCREWRDILDGMTEALRPGGRLIVTCAGPNRRPHSALDGGPWVGPDEWYSPIFPEELWVALYARSLESITVAGDQDTVLGTGLARP